VAYLVNERRGEIGVRLALGARRGRVATMVMMQSVRLAVIGTGIGLAVALTGGRVMRALLFGVSPADPAVFAIVAGGVLLIAAAASLGPARRATRIPPAEVLRAE
jgi:putative ABC transport system permease protein